MHAMTYILAQGALGLLEPFVKLADGILSGAVVVVLLAFLAPSMGPLITARFSSRWWQLPGLWFIPSAILLLVYAYSNPMEDLRSESLRWAHFPFALWSIAASVIGLVHLLTKWLRFVVSTSDQIGRIERFGAYFVYGLGALVTGGILVIDAFFAQGASAFFGLGVVLSGVLTLVNGRDDASSSRLVLEQYQRLFWLFGAVFVSLLTYAMFVGWGLIVLSEAERSALQGLVAAVVPMVVGSAICWKFRAWRSERRANVSEASVSTQVPPDEVGGSGS